jgi:hypothetical protein
VQLNVQRNSHYYYYKVMVPLLLIMILNIGSFALPVDDLNNRLQYSVNLFLSAFALMYVIAPDVPKTSYQTPIDRFILVTVVVLACTGIEAVLLQYLKRGNPQETCFPTQYNLALLQDVAMFWEWTDECVDRMMETVLIIGYIAYIVYEFLPPRLARDKWLEEQSEVREHCKVSNLTLVNGQQMEPKAILRLDGLDHHTSQILERPYAGAPKWLVGKYGIDADVSLDLGASE